MGHRQRQSSETAVVTDGGEWARWGLTYQHGMQVDAIHVMPFDFVQIVQLRTGGGHALELLMQLRDACLQLAALIGQQSKLGDVALGVASLIIVAQFGCKVKHVCLSRDRAEAFILTLHNECAQLGGQLEGDGQSTL